MLTRQTEQGAALAIFRTLKELGFEQVGQQGVKVLMQNGDMKIIFCAPCRHIRYGEKVMKFGTPAFNEFMYRLKQDK